MIFLKRSPYGQEVRLDGLSTQALLAMYVVDQVFESNGIKRTVITSVNDGKHSPTSLHNIGNAFDVRTRGLTVALVAKLVADIKARVTRHFDIVNEHKFKGPHIHVEYQPRRP